MSSRTPSYRVPRLPPAGVILAFPHPLVVAACVAELAVGALFGDPAVVEHHDLVDLVEPIGLVGDEQDGAALGGLEQVGGQCLAGVWVEVGGGFVEDQQRRVGEKRTSQRQALPFAAGDGRPVGADPGVPAAGEGCDPRQQPGASGGGLELLVGGAGPGEPQVVADGGVEQVGAGAGSTRDTSLARHATKAVGHVKTHPAPPGTNPGRPSHKGRSNMPRLTGRDLGAGISVSRRLGSSSLAPVPGAARARSAVAGHA